MWLQEAGYFTSHIGKYLNEYGIANPNEVPPGWSDWQGLVDRSTYRMYNYTINDNGALVTYGETAADYQTDVLAARAEMAIGEAGTAQPFFLSVGTLAPHDESTSPSPGPVRPAPRHLKAFSKEPLPKPPSFNEANVSDKPVAIRNLPLLTDRQIQGVTNGYRKRLASLLAVDDLVGRVVASLDRAGVLSNTMLVFTSDNGFFHGQHRVPKQKLKVYEESIRVPLLIRGGGFPVGATVNQFVSNIDLAPTIAQLAGANARRVMDGRPLLPLALDPDVARDRNLLIETTTYQAVRNPSFLYVEHNTGERELYDMRAGTANYDPFQLVSRHAAAAYAPFRTRLEDTLNRLRSCSGASCEAN